MVRCPRLAVVWLTLAGRAHADFVVVLLVLAGHWAVVSLGGGVLTGDGGTGYRQIQHLGPRESGTPIPDDRPRSSPQHSLRSHWRLIPNVWRAFISNSVRPVIQSCSVLQQRRDHCLTRANLLRRLGARAGATQRPGDHCHITFGTLAVPCCLRATADRSDK